MISATEDARIRWQAARGDETLKLDFPLTPESIVFDVGGYHGNWTDSIWRKYDCHIWLFEPVPEFYQACKFRFRNLPKIHCLPFGLWNRDLVAPFRIDEDSSSVYGNHPAHEVQLYDIVSFMAARMIPHVDLMALNCEGAEYHILTRLLDADMIDSFDHLLIQFHEVVPMAAKIRSDIRLRLARTHEESWCYPFVWESWRKRAS